MHPGHIGCDYGASYHLIRGHGAHADHHIAMKYACRSTGNIGQEHRHIASFFNMTHRDTGLKQVVLKGKAAANQEADQIIPPEIADFCVLSRQLSMFPNAVFRNISGDIGPVRNGMQVPVTCIRHLQQRTGAGIALSEQQKIISQGSWQNHQIGLGIAGTESGGRAGQLSASDPFTNLGRCFVGCTGLCTHEGCLRFRHSRLYGGIIKANLPRVNRFCKYG